MACNDDIADSLRSAVLIPEAVAGDVWYIFVDAWGGGNQPFALDIYRAEQDAAPTLDEVIATRGEDGDIRVRGTLSDANADIAGYAIQLIVDGELVEGSYRGTDYELFGRRTGDFTRRISLELDDGVEGATQVSVTSTDAQGNQSEPRVVDIVQRALVGENEACDPTAVANACVDGTFCSYPDADGNRICLQATPPSIVSADAYADEDRGCSYFPSGRHSRCKRVYPGPADAAGMPTGEALEGIVFGSIDHLVDVTFEGQVAVDMPIAFGNVVLVDEQGLTSEPLLVEVQPLPVRNENDACDEDQIWDRCVDGTACQLAEDQYTCQVITAPNILEANGYWNADSNAVGLVVNR